MTVRMYKKKMPGFYDEVGNMFLQEGLVLQVLGGKWSNDLFVFVGDQVVTGVKPNGQNVTLSSFTELHMWFGGSPYMQWNEWSFPAEQKTGDTFWLHHGEACEVLLVNDTRGSDYTDQLVLFNSIGERTQKWSRCLYESRKNRGDEESAQEITANSKRQERCLIESAPVHAESVYAHINDRTLIWQGRGRRPKWLVELLEEGHALSELLVTAISDQRD